MPTDDANHFDDGRVRSFTRFMRSYLSKPLEFVPNYSTLLDYSSAIDINDDHIPLLAPIIGQVASDHFTSEQSIKLSRHQSAYSCIRRRSLLSHKLSFHESVIILEELGSARLR